MFTIVKHEHGELKINPNCYIRIIYDYIREQLSIPSDREFDLYSEDGSACFIYRHAPNTDGKTILKPRQTYTLKMFRLREDDDDPEVEVADVDVEETAGPSLSSVDDVHQDDVNK